MTVAKVASTTTQVTAPVSSSRATPTYPTTCLACGDPCVALATLAEYAPWLCAVCHHAWWPCELDEGRALYRPGYNDFGWGEPMLTFNEQRSAETEKARSNGTSLPMEGIVGMADADLLEAAKKIKALGLLDAIKAELLVRGL